MGIDKIVFTGSAETGAQILQDIAPAILPAAMELSGCDAVVVRADADLDMVVRALAFGLRLNSGRTCIAPRRVIVARSVATELEGRLAEALASAPRVRLADAKNNRLLPLVSHAISSGAHLLTGELHFDRSITAPLVIAGVSPASGLLKEDFFAPVMSVITASDDSEAVCLVNQCPYGLGASVFSRDVDAAKALASRINAGNVVINDLIVPTADPRLPFGGRGLSGFGATRGSEGLLEMTALKVISLREGRMRPHYDPAGPGDDKLFLNFLTLLHSGRLRSKLSAFASVCAELLRRAKIQIQKRNA
jgi:acyl-CoA reductase-like NAD-dependent aldehyde dehydrogenase